MSIKTVYQSVKQLLGLLYVIVRYDKKLPYPDNYNNKVRYILPLEGAWTVVNGGVTKEFSHSWDVLTQRFAYDFLVVDNNGNSFHGDLTDPKSYYCYGLNILAPADGIVVHLEDRCTDSIIDSNGNAHCNSRDICGNHIVIKHAEDEYSFLAHIKKDSIIVKIGDKVMQGQYIAQCGNTGNSSQPHLHFHLQNKKSFYTSIGLPIEFSDVIACPKENYHMFDPREIQNDLLDTNGKRFIGRGQEVLNTSK